MNSLRKLVRSKPFVIVVAIVVLYTLGGFLLAPYLVRHYVPEIIQEQLHKKAAIGEVRVNPYVYTLEVNDFRMEEPDGQPIADFKRLFVDFELKGLFRWAWTFRQVSIECPQIETIIAPDGGLNLAQLTPPPGAPPGENPGENRDKGIRRLVFEEISIDQGEIDFTDRRQSRPASIRLKPVQLEVKNLTTLLGQEGPETVTAVSEDGETIRWSGSIGLNPVKSKGTLALENIRIATLWKFARDALMIDSPAGKLSITSDYSLDLSGAEPQVGLSNLAVALTGLALKLEGTDAPFLELPEARLGGGRFDLSRQQVDIGQIAVHGGRARLAVDEGGSLNLGRIVKTSGVRPSAPVPAAAAGAAKTWRGRLNGFDLRGFAIDYQDISRKPGFKAGMDSITVGLKAEAEAGGEQGEVIVNGIAVGVSGFRAGLADAAGPALEIAQIDLEGGAYDLVQNALSVDRIAGKGGVIDVRREADGAINLALLSARPQEGPIAGGRAGAAAEGGPFRFSAKTVSASGLQAAFSDLAVRPDGPIVGLEDISLVLENVDGRSPMTFEGGFKVRQGGQINASGTLDPTGPSVDAEVQVAGLDLTLFQPYVAQAAAAVVKSGTFSTSGALRHGIKEAGARTAYHGGFKVDNLRVTETGRDETLVGWRAVQTDKLAIGLEPNRIEIGDVRVTQPTGKFVIEKDRSVNIAKVIKSGPAEKGPRAGAAPVPADSFPYRVRRVVVSEGRVDFADLSLITPFGIKIHELKGAVAGISSAKAARAQVGLDGHVDEYGTAKIEGELNTSDPRDFVDISLIFRNVEMSRLTSYSGEFAGRKIDSGKLSVDLKYRIDKGRLAGDNQIVVERLTLGERVKSPQAVDLPLDLAVALLEDSNGVIEIGLPVKGDLTSPEFSFGQLVWKAFVNMLNKIVTSPFRALGALIPGGGEETLNAVAFEAGSPAVPPPEKEKLAKLAVALEKRPQLKLVVQGRYNPEADLAVLRTASLGRALAVRLGQGLAAGEGPGPVDFSSPESEKALKAMFAERFGSEALKTLKAELKAAEKGKADAPVELAKVLFGRLAEAEPIGDAELGELADARAQAVVSELGGPNGVAAGRLDTKASAAMDKGGEVSAALTLEVMRP